MAAQDVSFRSLKFFFAAAVAFAVVSISAAPQNIVGEMSLNGQWEIGIDRHYDNQTIVPGLPQNPNEMSPGTLWYRRTVQLPEGNWTTATLRLNGARFAPTIYVNGKKIAQSEGGMAPIEFPLRSDQVAPAKKIELEIALKSLRDLDPLDASAVPVADRWRSDISSGLWDTVSLHFSGDERISRVIPFTDFFHDRVSVHWEISGGKKISTARTVQVFVLDQSGKILAHSEPSAAKQNHGATELNLHRACKPWSPDAPNLYKIKLILSDGGKIQDSCKINFGLRDFRTVGLHFALNGAPIQLRGGSVVWHRWLRDPQAKTLAFDSDWFEKNIVLRLKSYGANYLRFHLGLPPEKFLDMCDRDGLLVQMEWPFFHGIPASPASMKKQWRDWLAVGARHPCVVLLQPWNETEGDELTNAWAALNSVLPEFPPYVIDHRDVIPIHKYWWSLFENLGLYYDSATQFDKPIMVDEFGGNYLDYNGDIGEDPAAHDGFTRFLGRNQTRDERLEFQAESNSKIAEYWRRIGAAGFAPFCILSSPQDGNTWFLGKLKDGNPKPVWNALSAAFAPVSLSLEVWDRNYTPAESVNLPLYFFNDTGKSEILRATVRIVSEKNQVMSFKTVSQKVAAHGAKKINVPMMMPNEIGDWRFEAELISPKTTAAPVISKWDCRTLNVKVPETLKHIFIGISPDDTKLKQFFAQNEIPTVALDDPKARALVLSARLWTKTPPHSALLDKLQKAVDGGKSVVLLDIGPRDLGQGYKKNDLGPLEGAPKVEKPYVIREKLFSGIQLAFTEVAEPESHLHPAANDDSLWNSLPLQSTWIWNGLRGGLVVPSADMNVSGLSAPAFLSLWASRGADAQAVRNDKNYYAYELAGYYAFSPSTNQAAVAKLRGKVKSLVEDAPSLQNRINPDAPVECADIAQIYRQSSADCEAEQLIPLASCGKNLSRIPVVELIFGSKKGNVILSQALTAGRLVRGYSEPGLYGIRHDPAAEQFVLNMIATALMER